MKTLSGNSQNYSLLQPFAVKNNKKKVTSGNRAITFNRCSSEKQDFEYQSKITADHVARNNWELVKSFGLKESASIKDRKEFKEILKFCYKEKINHIVFFSYDRFSRDGNDNLLDTLREKGIKVHAATQSVDDETPSGRFSQAMYLKFAKFENDQRREKIIEGMRNKLRRGEIVTAPPIGYEKRFVNGDKQHDFEKPQCFINQTGRFLQQAFFWKANENVSNLEIIRRLKKMGLSLAPPELTRIFRNIFYCGLITNKLLDEGEIVRGKHEPLIDEATFLRVNGITAGNPSGWKTGRFNEEMPLKSSVRCAKCNRPLTAYLQKPKYVYYKCPNQGCCVNISNKLLHKLFVRELSQFVVMPQLMPLVRCQMESTYQMLNRNETEREKPMKDQLTRLNNELKTMERRYLTTDAISEDTYKEHSEDYKRQIKQIEDELQKLVRDSSKLDLYLDQTLQFLENLPKIWEKLNFEGKVRLQKLVFPAGLVYNAEKHTVRTSSVNPIFSAITTISQNLVTEANQENYAETEKFHQVYLGFPSSNFLWENLEKTATTIRRIETNLAYKPFQVVSMTGNNSSDAYYIVTNSTEISPLNKKVSELNLNVINTHTGSTWSYLKY